MQPAAAVLHPFLRRVLLHALTRRGDADFDRWEVVHGRLRDYYRGEGGDVTRAMYHALALGDLAQVVTHLDERFAVLDKTAWLAELHAITAAPRHAKTDQTPRDEAMALASGAALDDVLSRLVPAMWISKDPLGDPNRTLDVFITDGLTLLARRAGPEAGVLFEEAQRYGRRGQRECWAVWPPADLCRSRRDRP